MRERERERERERDEKIGTTFECHYKVIPWAGAAHFGVNAEAAMHLLLF